jgi:amino acid permease
MSRYEYTNQKGDIGFWPTLFTFIKVNIVAGFIFLPNGFEKGGWLFSIIAIIVLCILNIYCNICISECSDPANTYSLSRIGYKAMGNVGYYTVEFILAFAQICFPCSYANLSAQIINRLIKVWFGIDEDYYLYIAIGLGLIIIPLCLVRKISKFASLHFIGDIAMLATIICLTYETVMIVTSDRDWNINNVKMFNTQWYKLVGMSVSSLEGVGTVLPIKVYLNYPGKYD